MTDEVKEPKDAKPDKSLAEVPGDKTPSSTEPKLSKDVEAEVQKRISDILAKKGDEAKILREEVDGLKARVQKEEDVKFVAVAEKYGKTVEDLKTAGYDTADKVEAAASLFGGSEIRIKPLTRPDSGKGGGGGGELTVEQVKRMSPQERAERRAEIAKMPLTLGAKE